MSFPAREPLSPLGSRTRPGLVLRIVAHLAVWFAFADAAVRAVLGGWRPVSDAAVIAIRSWDVLTAHGLLVGEATRLAHGVYDLGPAEFWLLALPVRVDPAHEVLWGRRCGARSPVRWRSRRPVRRAAGSGSWPRAG